MTWASPTCWLSAFGSTLRGRMRCALRRRGGRLGDDHDQRDPGDSECDPGDAPACGGAAGPTLRRRDLGQTDVRPRACDRPAGRRKSWATFTEAARCPFPNAGYTTVPAEPLLTTVHDQPVAAVRRGSGGGPELYGAGISQQRASWQPRE